MAQGALVFGANTTDRVTGPTAAGVTKLSVGVWVYPTTLAVNQHIVTRYGGTPSQGWRLAMQSNTGTYRMQWTKAVGVSAASALSTSLPMALNTWYFVGATVDQSATPSCVLYIGGLGTAMASPTMTQAEGAGSFDSEAGNALTIGNVPAATTPWKGNIAIATAYNGVILTSGNFETLRYDTAGAVAGNSAGLLYRLGMKGADAIEYMVGTPGTVTGATQGAGPFAVGEWLISGRDGMGGLSRGYGDRMGG